MWIKTWTPIWEAKKILWDFWYYFSPDHNYYSIISDRLMNYLEKNTLGLEPFSIDEAFCEITGLDKMYGITTLRFIKNLQRDILKNIWIPVSIWVSNTRIKAKIYSKINKPYGIYIWNNTIQEKNLFCKLPLKDIPYIWKSHQQRYKYCCRTIYDYISLWFWKIKKDIWKNWTDLWLELSWVNAFVVKKSLDVKSIWRSRSFNKQITSDYIFLKKQLINHFDIVYESITDKNLEIKSFSVMFRDKAFNTYVFTNKLRDYTNTRSIIFNSLIELFDRSYNSKILYRSIWVVLGDFRSYLPRQLNISFKKTRSKDNNYKLSKVINSINKKYNTHKICFWNTLLNSWYDAKLGIRKI